MKNVDNEINENELDISQLIFGDFILCTKIEEKHHNDRACAIKISEIKKIKEYDKDMCIIYLYKNDHYFCPIPMKTLLNKMKDKK